MYLLFISRSEGESTHEQVDAIVLLQAGEKVQRLLLTHFVFASPATREYERGRSAGRIEANVGTTNTPSERLLLKLAFY